MGLLNYVGTIAAICTTGAFIPQIVKIKRQGGEDLSFSMLFIYLAGVLLWLVYGLLLHAPAVIWANAVSSFLVSVALVLKLTHSTRVPQSKSEAAPDRLADRAREPLALS